MRTDRLSPAAAIRELIDILVCWSEFDDPSDKTAFDNALKHIYANVDDTGELYDWQIVAE